MVEHEFNTEEPIAYLITWTTYGTWLPGDERGSWHRGQYESPNQLFRVMAESHMKEAVFVLSEQDRNIVEKTVAKHCDIRSWKLHALNARTNHVHVVVTARAYEPEDSSRSVQGLVYATLEISASGA